MLLSTVYIHSHETNSQKIARQSSAVAAAAAAGRQTAVWVDISHPLIPIIASTFKKCFGLTSTWTLRGEAQWRRDSHKTASHRSALT